jgi:hypothetical protein
LTTKAILDCTFVYEGSLFDFLLRFEKFRDDRSS